jgi:predicted RNase H-like nuclease
MLAVGIGSWSGGWVSVAVRDGRFEESRTAREIRELLTYWNGADAVGIDTPLRLPITGTPRAADLAARQIVGGTVWNAPPKVVAAEDTWAEANAISRQLFGKGVSKPAYYLGRRAVELAKFTADRGLCEVHPDVSFWAMNQRTPLTYGKKTWAGQVERRRLLAGAGILIRDDLGKEVGLIPTEDVFDTAAAAWTAQRAAAGRAGLLPEGARPGTPAITY